MYGQVEVRPGWHLTLEHANETHAEKLKMKCFQHNDRDAVGTCATCSGAGCNECLLHYSGAKMCKQCAHQLYEYRRNEILGWGKYAQTRLNRALIVALSFGAMGFILAAAMASGNGFVAAMLAGVFGGLWAAYGWGSNFLAVIPFVRFFGSRMTGGAISGSPTGALFGALWFWIVAGWWLLFFGSVFAFCGGGIFQFFKLRGMAKRAQADAASLPAPVAPSAGQLQLA
jgi:hypothetical protein